MEEVTISKIEKKLQNVGLSKRLECIVELAGSGDTLCDVGCDHAHVPIRLLQSGHFRRAIGMDVIDGPLGKARGNLELYGLADMVELRLSDGLDAFRKGEADTLVVTGMGGTLMREILMREPDKTRSLQVLVLGPQSDPDRIRSAIRELGFSLADERLIFEDGKYYPVLRAVRGGAVGKENVKTTAGNGFALTNQDGETELFPPEIPPQIQREAEDLFGPLLLRRRDPVLREFLVRRIAVLKKIRDSVSRAAKERRPQAPEDTSSRERRSFDNPRDNKENAGQPGTADHLEINTEKNKNTGTVDSSEENKNTGTVDSSEENKNTGTVDSSEENKNPEINKGAKEKNSTDEYTEAEKQRRAEELKRKHLDKMREIEHSLNVFQAALKVFT